MMAPFFLCTDSDQRGNVRPGSAVATRVQSIFAGFTQSSASVWAGLSPAAAADADAEPDEDDSACWVT